MNVAQQKMEKNAQKAIEEHRTKNSQAYVSVEDLFPALENSVKSTQNPPLTFKYLAADAQGVRPTMEDAHFFQETENGMITGVFDGHGGVAVAEYANRAVQENFFSTLEETQGNVYRAFELLIDRIHNHVAQNPEWENIGSTAVVCYVDKKTHHIYTATLGDSEANIYRKFDDKLKSIPLSCIRDWSSKKDAHRASIALGRPQIAINWPKISNPKYLRFPYPFFGINVSRSIGDVLLSGSPEKPGVIHKPKITRIQVKSGDLLILACDGLKDYVSDNEIVSILKNPPPNPAKHLVNYAIDEGNSLDNVTVLAIAIN